MISTIGIICPKCKKKNAYNTNKKSIEEVDVKWITCGFCFKNSNKGEWK